MDQEGIIIEQLEKIIKEYKQEKQVNHNYINRICINNNDISFNYAPNYTNDVGYISIKEYRFYTRGTQIQERFDKEFLNKLNFGDKIILVNLVCTSDMISGDSISCLKKTIQHLINNRYKICSNTDMIIYGDQEFCKF